MKKLYYIILLTFCFGCSSKHQYNFTEDDIKNKLQELYVDGYSTKELSLRTYYTEEQIINSLQGKQNLPDTYYDRIEKLYQLNKEEEIIPIYKLQKTSSECLWNIYIQTQNSLLLSQYTNIGISQVVNALTLRYPLSDIDSIRALIAYVNMQYDIGTIPNKIIASPYFHQYSKENGIMNIKVPQTSYTINNQDKNKLTYYLWQAEQFELAANKQLKNSLQQKIKQYATLISKHFVENDIDSYINDILNLFKDKEEVAQFYREKLKEKLNLSSIESELKNEILSYCVSINSSRILLVNDLLNSNTAINNLPIADSLKLHDFVIKTENLNRLISNRRIDFIKNTSVDVTGTTLTTIGTMIPSGGSGFIMGILAWEGLSKIADDIDSMFRSQSDIHINEQMDTLKIKIRKQIEQSLSNQTIKDTNILNLLNENSHLFYNQIRQEFNIKEEDL